MCCAARSWRTHLLRVLDLPFICFEFGRVTAPGRPFKVIHGGPALAESPAAESRWPKLLELVVPRERVDRVE